MADIELVIKIHEKDYQAMKNRQIPSSVFDVIPISVLDVLMKGIPLPKGHGRLIDADAIKYTHAIARSLDDGHNWNELCVTENEIYDAPTIIEADKG